MEKFRILTERLFLRSPNINICFRITIEGNVDKKQFESAMDNICKRHPLLNCSIEIDKDHNAWFVPNTSHIGIEYYQSEDLPDWQIWYKKTDGIPFNIVHGPLVKICVIIDAGQMEIIILGHHIVSDGIGYLILSKDILLALDNRLETIPQELLVNNKFKNGNRLGFFSKLYAKKLAKEWRENRINFSEDEYNRFFQQYRNTYISRLYINSVDEINLKKIVEKSKTNEMTVNELLTSAFSAAIVMELDNYTGKAFSVGIVANTRNELKTKPYYCMENYVTGISVKINYVSKNSFILNAKSIASIMRKRLNDVKNRHLVVNFLKEFDSDLIESIMYACYGDYELPIPKKIGELIEEGTKNKGMGMSNLGRHEFNNYETFKFLDIQFIGPAFPAKLISVYIITANSKLNICLRYNENEIKAENVKGIYKKTMELLDIN
ncbi:MAG: hypothetical protein Pg6C_19680 [Treponemataceae bacterium]|nr:MAG: hypothetical protein Pg6C_19680 [Treponemataceae bacterium]